MKIILKLLASAAFSFFCFTLQPSFGQNTSDLKDSTKIDSVNSSIERLEKNKAKTKEEGMEIMQAFDPFNQELVNIVLAGILLGLLGFFANKYIAPYFKGIEKENLNKKGDSINNKSNAFNNSLLVNSSNLIDYQDKFIGRKNELEQLYRYFFKEDKRLVTIYGPGGIGKTRISHYFGNEYEKLFKDGVVFVDLIQATTLVGIVEEVIKAFGATNASLQIVTQDAVVEHLKDKTDLLIILDNFEQVQEHFPDSVEYWLKKFNKGVKFLITSRNRLFGPYETPIELDGIDEGNSLDNSKELFYERCKKVLKEEQVKTLLKDDESIETICKKLNGIPLAIEIVSARIRSKNLKQIRQELENFLQFKSLNHNEDDKHRTLYDTINWSYELLSSEEKNVFIQMGIFKDGCDKEAFKNVIETIEELDEDVLHSLIDKSLIKVVRGRYFPRYIMYVAINSFTVKKLVEIENKLEYRNLYNRWTDYYLNYVTFHNSKLDSKSAKKSMDLIELELENLFEIQNRALKLNDPLTAAKAILAVTKTLEVRGPSQFRIPKLEMSLSAFGEEKNESVLDLTIEISRAYWAAGLWDKNLAYLYKARELAYKLKKHRNLSLIYKEMGKTYDDRGHHNKSIALLSSGIDIINENNVNDDPLELQLLMQLAASNEKKDNLETCLKLLKKAQELAISLQSKINLGIVHNMRGLALWHHGYINQALEELDKAASYSNDVDNKTWKPAHLTNKGLVLTDDGQYSEAIKSFSEASDLHNKLGYKHWAAVNYGGWGRVLMLQSKDQDDLIIAKEYCTEGFKISEQIFYPENLTMHLGDLARIEFYQNNFQTAFEQSKKAVSLAIKKGSVKTIRHFSNLTILYSSSMELNKISVAKEARKLLEKLYPLDFVKNPRIPKIKEDIELLSKYDQKMGESPNENLLDPNLKFLNLDRNTIISRCSQLTGVDSYGYPWYFLEDDLKKSGKKSLLVFTYGSLLNANSASTTFSNETTKNAKTAIAFGIKRTFNYNLPDEVAQRGMYQTETNINSYSALNVEFTGLSSDYCNGLVIEIPIEEIEILRQREIGYDFVQTKCLYLDTKIWEDQEVFVLSCEHKLYKDKWLTNNNLPPHPNYLNICMDGAKSFGEQFFMLWRNTTYKGNLIELIDLE